MTKEEQKYEQSVVTTLNLAHTIAKNLFGADYTTDAVFTIYEYLSDEDVDEEEYLKDLKRMYEHAKVAFSVNRPTPDQVLGLFDLIFNGDEDES